MAEGIYTALSGAVANEQALEIVSNNLANVSTHGFKGDAIHFKEVLAQNNPKAQSAHVQLDSIMTDFSQGVLKPSKNMLDVALVGRGFFVVEGPQGDMLTRNGAFTLRGDGALQTVDGLAVQGQNGAIRIDPGAKVRLDSFGSVFVTPPSGGSSSTAMAEVLQDRLRVVDVEDPQQLRRAGHGLWDASGATPIHCDAPVRPGAIEQSNVNPIQMMTKLVQIQRAYEGYNRTIQQIHATEQKAVSQLG